jgi:asparagine N-glycosylation enzyme membrane subunit Stt3
MSELRKSLGLGAFALVPIACCVGIPLIATAGISVALAAWVGGVAFGALVLVAAFALLILRRRRQAERGSGGGC